MQNIQTKERRRSSVTIPYMFFLFEIVVIFEISYIYTTIFGTTPMALTPLVLLGSIALFNAVKRLSRVLQRIRFSNYNFQSN